MPVVHRDYYGDSVHNFSSYFLFYKTASHFVFSLRGKLLGKLENFPISQCGKEQIGLCRSGRFIAPNILCALHSGV